MSNAANSPLMTDIIPTVVYKIGKVCLLIKVNMSDTHTLSSLAVTKI